MAANGQIADPSGVGVVLHRERWSEEVSKATGFQRLPCSGTASRRASGSHCADVYAECVTKCFIYALKYP